MGLLPIYNAPMSCNAGISRGKLKGVMMATGPKGHLTPLLVCPVWSPGFENPRARNRTWIIDTVTCRNVVKEAWQHYVDCFPMHFVHMQIRCLSNRHLYALQTSTIVNVQCKHVAVAFMRISIMMRRMPTKSFSWGCKYSWQHEQEGVAMTHMDCSSPPTYWWYMIVDVIYNNVPGLLWSFQRTVLSLWPLLLLVLRSLVPLVEWGVQRNQPLQACASLARRGKTHHRTTGTWTCASITQNLQCVMSNTTPYNRYRSIATICQHYIRCVVRHNSHMTWVVQGYVQHVPCMQGNHRFKACSHNTCTRQCAHLSGFLIGLCRPCLGTALRLPTNGCNSSGCVLGTFRNGSPLSGSGRVLVWLLLIHEPFTAGITTRTGMVPQCAHVCLVTCQCSWNTVQLLTLLEHTATSNLCMTDRMRSQRRTRQWEVGM